MHPLLALEPGARLDVEGLVSVRATRATGLPLAPIPGRADWPETPGTDGRPVALDVVRDPAAGTALKVYGGWSSRAGTAPAARVARGRGGGPAGRTRLELAWYA
jgi:hypothetical protein